MCQNRQLWRVAPVLTHPTPIVFLSPQMGLGRGARLCAPAPPCPHAYTIASNHPPYPPAFMAPQKIPPVGTRHAGGCCCCFVEVLAAPGFSLPAPSVHHRHQPRCGSAQYHYTVILITKHLHLCIHFCVNRTWARSAASCEAKNESSRAAREALDLPVSG